jgi:hypothetical protein
MDSNKFTLLDERQRYLYGASAIANSIGSVINFSLLNQQAKFSALQAGQAELTAQQNINQMREQFLENVSKLQYGAARRGIKVNSGSVQSNMETSAKNLGDDIGTVQRNAQEKAGALRTQARIDKINNFAGLMGSLGNIGLGLAEDLSRLDGEKLLYSGLQKKQ